MSKHEIGHLEISATNPVTSSQFYSELFGWKFDAMPVPTPNDPNYHYHMYSPESGASIAFSVVDGQMFKEGQLLPYITTDSVEASLTKATALGGKTVMPKMEIPGGDFIGIFADPVGNMIGLIEHTR